VSFNVALQVQCSFAMKCRLTSLYRYSVHWRCSVV